jgi:hypothetical protein
MTAISSSTHHRRRRCRHNRRHRRCHRRRCHRRRCRPSPRLYYGENVGRSLRNNTSKDQTGRSRRPARRRKLVSTSRDLRFPRGSADNRLERMFFHKGGAQKNMAIEFFCKAECYLKRPLQWGKSITRFQRISLFGGEDDPVKRPHISQLLPVREV